MSSFSSIVTQTYLDTSSKAILLRGNEYIKPISISERWTRFRIGLLLSATPDSTNNLIEGLLVVGLCQNTATSWGSSNSRFLGGSVGAYPSGASVGTNWTFNSVPPNSFFNCSTEYVFSKLGSTYTASAANYTFRLPLLDANPRRGIYIMDIVKGSPNYTVQMISGVAANMSSSYGMGDLFNAMEQANATPTLGGNQFTTAGATAVAFSETSTNYLSTVNIYWNRWSFPLQLSGLATYIVY